MNAKEAREKMDVKRLKLVQKQIDFITRAITKDILSEESWVQSSSFELGTAFKETIEHFKNEGYIVSQKSNSSLTISWH